MAADFLAGWCGGESFATFFAKISAVVYMQASQP